MPRKSEKVHDKRRGSCSSLEAVKHFLQSDRIPEGYSKNDKRALRRRARSFVLINDELYFNGGRSRHNRGLIVGDEEGNENPENEPDHTQVLRKVLFSPEEQQEAINKAHIGYNGVHYGMEKTQERVSDLYYWMGIVYCVRNTIHRCLNCSSRSKTFSPSFSHNISLNSETQSGDITITPTINESGTHYSEVPAQVCCCDVGSDNGDSISADDLREGINRTNDVTLTVSTMVKQELKKQAADVYYVAKDICSYFWQKVEIQVFGPYQAGGKQIFVTIALDSYSQFPEATTMEVLSSATLTNFVLNLFCRYGVMEKLLLLQNQVTKNKEFFISKDMFQAGISPTLFFPNVNPLDERWQHIERSLNHFVTLYPEFWFYCLEAFMVPLRIALPPEADYSPYFLVHGREPPIPDRLSKLYIVDSSISSEVRLTEEQEKAAVDMVTAAYGVHSDTPSISVTVRDPPTAAEPEPIPEPTTEPAPEASTYVREMQGVKKNVSGWKFRKRRKKQQGRSKAVVSATEEEENMGDDGKRMKEKMATDDYPVAHFDDVEEDDSSDTDATYIPEVKSVGKKSHQSQQPVRSSSRRRIATLKALEANIAKKILSPSLPKQNSSSFTKEKSQSSKENIHQISVNKSSSSSKTGTKLNKDCFDNECNDVNMLTDLRDVPNSVTFKRKRGRPRKTSPNDLLSAKTFTKRTEMKSSLEEKMNIIKIMQQLPLDTFYFILKQYKEYGWFPPCMSSDAKNSIARLSQIVDVTDGKLYSKTGKSAGRLIITGEKARISVLQKAHARGEEHHGRNNVLKYLSSLNVFWNGMSLDLDAFIHACPDCIQNNPFHNKTVVRIPSKSVALTLQDRWEDRPHLSEDEEEESSYEDLIQYLTDGTFPSTATHHQQLRIKQRSNDFCIINGSLYYSKFGEKSVGIDDFQPRQVLFSEKVRQEAIGEAHIEDGNHISQQDTQAKLRCKFFWSGMTFDIMAYIMGCCMGQSLSTAVVPHRNPEIQDRVNKLIGYYINKVVPKLDTSLITASEAYLEVEGAGARSGNEECRESESERNSNEALQKGEANQCPMRTKREVDEKVVKAVETIIAKVGKSIKVNNLGKPDMEQLPFENLRSRKDAHKCQYCGKFISGNVAYRIHLYKHTGVKPFSCSVCCKSFTTSKSLQVHTRKHTGVKPYLCNQCGREFFRGTSFKYHLKTHNRTKLKPLPCDQCDRKFLTQNRLDKHKEFKHPAVPKVYMCKHCGKVFTTTRSLKFHEQSHSNYRRYQCHLCSEEFNRKEHLETHCKSVHDEDSKVPKASARCPAALQPVQQSHQHQHLLPIILHTGQGDQQHLHEALSQPHLLQNVGIPTNGISVIHWSEEEHQQAASHIAVSQQPAAHITISDHAGNRISEHQIVTDMETYQTHPHSLSQPSHTTVHILTQASLPLSNVQPSDHLPVNSSISHLQTLHHTLQHAASDVLLQQEAVPVQYEVECLSGEAQGLTEADLNAVHMLAQASLAGQNILH